MFDSQALTSDEAVENLRNSLEASAVRCRKWKLGFLASFGLSFVAMAAAAVMFPHEQMGYWAILGVIAIFLSFGMVAVIESTEGDIKLMLREVSPLSETESCVEALALCQQSAQARRIRDSALKAGRQLYAFDYAEMVAHSQADGQETARAAQREACKALHQIA
jgi:hypothetical protein